MTLHEITALLASKEAELNTSQESGVSFRVCEILCHIEGAAGHHRYFVRALLPHELASREELARYIEAHNHVKISKRTVRRSTIRKRLAQSVAHLLP
jgi:hypothetical protein